MLDRADSNDTFGHRSLSEDATWPCQEAGCQRPADASDWGYEVLADVQNSESDEGFHKRHSVDGGHSRRASTKLEINLVPFENAALGVVQL